MRRPLGAKNKFDFVDGTIPVPNPFDPSYKAWCRCNMLIHSWIMNSVEESIAQSIVYLENVIDVWNELKERFSRGDFIRISELQIEIYGLKQGTKSISEFFTALKLLWVELEAYLPMPVCNCPHKCMCVTGIVNARTQHDLIRTIRFFTGLNDSFDLVRSQILLMDHLPQINKIFSMVIQYERQFVSSSVSLDLDDNKAMINAADTRSPQGRRKGGYNANFQNNATPSGIAYSLSHSTYGSWIIDSGACDRICTSFAFFDNYHSIAPVQVKMANGSIYFAKYAGIEELEDVLLGVHCSTSQPRLKPYPLPFTTLKPTSTLIAQMFTSPIKLCGTSD
ncbi:retrovirus-related Pol polyprotein from transposon TNT 1-94 [Trifolium pratense]|uniref:Retrovirus-related Pol polyprotein from transposon TNT 1-94 n=1 Tax=Trifolium pratense TaxID=57577 RepID=A0A2K3L0A4_TRIPR|nr:retrovirus-related Pol polyprotein from transposon TNT 1-94 [Trifolium pratense]